MSDNYFVDTTSTVVGAGGADPDGGVVDVATHTDGAGGGETEDAIFVSPEAAPDAVASGADAAVPDGALPLADGATDVAIADVASDLVTALREAGRDGIVANVVDTGGTVIFSDDFESDAVGAVPSGWARVGGSASDWNVVADSSQVLAQTKSPSTTLRVCHASASTSGAASVSARIRVTQYGSSGTTTAMLCIRYVVADGSYECLALEPGVGAQIKTNLGDGPVWPSLISLGAWNRAKLGVDASGLLSASLEGALLGTFRPSTSLATGSIAVATQAAEAEFDDVVVTVP